MTIRAQIIMPAVSGLPEDAITNTLHFNQDGVTPNWPNLDDIIFDFYDTQATGSTGSIAHYMSGNSVGNEWTIKYYNLDDPKPRVPVHEETRTVTLPAIDPLPAEVALCISFQAQRESGVPQARRRNRIYIGGLHKSNITDGRPDTIVLTNFAKQARAMLAAANSSATWSWVVYSPTLQHAAKVETGWVDNSYDTQRRRGPAPTARTLWDDTDPA